MSSHSFCTTTIYSYSTYIELRYINFDRIFQIDIRKLQLAKVKIRTDESTARNDSVGERWNENGEGRWDPQVES